jgi:hypothetical protein
MLSNEMDLAKVASFERSSLKSEARRLFEKSRRHPFCESRLKIPRHLVQPSAIRILILNAGMKIHRAIGIKNKENPPFYYIFTQRNKP